MRRVANERSERGEEPSVSRGDDIGEQRIIPLRTKSPISCHIVAEPDVASIRGELEVPIYMHRQARLDGKREEAVRLPNACNVGWVLICRRDWCCDTTPRDEADVRVLGIARDRSCAPTAVLVTHHPRARRIRCPAVTVAPPTAQRKRRTASACANVEDIVARYRAWDDVVRCGGVPGTEHKGAQCAEVCIAVGDGGIEELRGCLRAWAPLKDANACNIL